ncbi:MAG: hypothetical protein ACU0CO_00065 [Shimia sp.]
MRDAAPLALRPPERVMSLPYLGAMMPCRLSFLRVLMRRLAGVRLRRPLWEMDALGHGRSVHAIEIGGHTYSLVAISRPLADADRSDRVIATAWDAAFALCDGVPDAADLARLEREVPGQERAHLTDRELVLSRANRSVRVFDHLVAALRSGTAPDPDILACGYAMRTTAVYGNGKFGLAGREVWADRPGLGGPFMAEMLAVWMIRAFSHDLVEHVGGAPLPRAVKRALGIGNATGLGMAPFLVSHPGLLDAWIGAREVALGRVRAHRPRAPQARALMAGATEAAAHLEGWQVPDVEAARELAALRRGWAAFRARLTVEGLTVPGGLDAAFLAAAEYGPGVEQLAAAWLIEPFGDLVDDLGGALGCEARPCLDGATTCDAQRAAIETDLRWALDVDWGDPAAQGQFWYVSEEKAEPRIGARGAEPGAEVESPLGVARAVAALHADLPGDDTPLWRFLASAPHHRWAARRVQALAGAPYGEIRANLLAEDAAPIHLLRAKLACFGAARFDPKSRLWTRVTLAQGLPLGDELGQVEAPWLPQHV